MGAETVPEMVVIVLIALMLCLVAPISAQPDPFVITGYITYENGTACNGPNVAITNLENGKEWHAENSSSSNYYQLSFVNGTDVNVSERLQFEVTSSGSEESKSVVRAVTSTDVDRGGLLNYDISLSVPSKQTWYFSDSDVSGPVVVYANYNKSMTKGVEGGDTKITLAPGQCVWFYADQVAVCTVSFPAGTWTVSYWVKALSINESNIPLYTRLHVVTPSGDTTTITEEWNSITYTGEVQDNVESLVAGSFSVPQGGRFALEVLWNESANGNLELYCNPSENQSSRVTSPSSDPGYPVPELPSILFLGVGLLAIATHLKVQRRWRE